MNSTLIEITIQDGRITLLEPHLLPTHGRGWLTIPSDNRAEQRPRVRVEIAEDGLPIIRGEGPVITSELVRQIEGSTV